MSDLIDDLNFYVNIFGELKHLLIDSHLQDSHLCSGYAIFLLLKCASIVEWVLFLYLFIFFIFLIICRKIYINLLMFHQKLNLPNFYKQLLNHV